MTDLTPNEQAMLDQIEENYRVESAKLTAEGHPQGCSCRGALGWGYSNAIIAFWDNVRRAHHVADVLAYRLEKDKS